VRADSSTACKNAVSS